MLYSFRVNNEGERFDYSNIQGDSFVSIDNGLYFVLFRDLTVKYDRVKTGKFTFS